MVDEKKSLDKDVEHTFTVLCNGRDSKQRPALGLASDDLVTAKVKVRFQTRGQMITLDVECKYACGAHGGKCNAGIGEGVCPYSIDLPYAIDNQYGGEQ